MMVLALAASLMVQQPFVSEAPGIMAALTQETVEIRENFSGTSLVLYGATRGLTLRDEIIVVLRGPDENLRVMRKRRSFGIWINADPIEFRSVPSYYAIASSLPLEAIATPDALARDEIGLASRLHPTIDADNPAHEEAELVNYRAAVTRSGSREALYAATPGGVEVLDGGLFRAVLKLPPRTPVGNYSAEVYLFRDGRPIASRTTSLRVEKAGIERIIYEFAHNAPMIYGLFCVALAMLAGYIAAAIFGRD
jgi:uncharacterized protein (TIGR02186 family)